MLTFVLLALGFICFVAAASGRVSAGRINLLALGAAFWILVPLIGAWP
jgi:hypothetical protein